MVLGRNEREKGGFSLFTKCENAYAFAAAAMALECDFLVSHYNGESRPDMACNAQASDCQCSPQGLASLTME